MHTFLAEVEQGDTLRSCGSTSCKQVSFLSPFSAIFLAFLCFSLVILLFKMSPKHTAEDLSSDPMHKKAVVCFMEKIHVLYKLHSGMSYSAVGHELNVHESTTYIKWEAFRQKHT